MMELCGRCQHSNDHVGKECQHEGQVGPCPCPSGMRSDVFANLQLQEIGSQLLNLNLSMAKLLLLQQTALGLQVEATPDGNGGLNLQARKSNALVLPRN